MTDTVRLWMQEKLDGVLADEQDNLLEETLQRDQAAAEEYGRLAQIDRAFSRAPMLRASNRLAATIMARLSEQLQVAAEIDQLPEDVRQAFLISLSLVSLTTMPMMVASSWMAINRRDTRALQHSIETAIQLEVLLVRSLIFLLQEVEVHMERDPKKAQFILSALPVIFGGMLESLGPQSLIQSVHVQAEAQRKTAKSTRRKRSTQELAKPQESWRNLEEAEPEEHQNQKRRSRLENDS